MPRHLILVAACAMPLLSSACSDEGDGAGSSGGAGGRVSAAGGAGAGGAAGGAADAGVVGVFPNAYADSEYLYEGSELKTFELVLSEENRALLDADPAAEQYVEGALRFEGVEYGPVGIRYKGSIGAFQTCTSVPGFMPSGEKTCPKLSMKVKFNWAHPDGLFYGMKRIQFHSMNNDATLLKERLGYSLFREMGVAAPRVAHVRLQINGDEAGLFALVEQIEGTFARRNFPEGGKGNLYKEVWPVYSDPEAYRPWLKTNEDESPSFDKMVRFAEELGAAADAELPAVVSRWMDVEQTMRYIAVDRAIQNDDGMFHWYCAPGGGSGAGVPRATISFAGSQCFNHNYFWYESTADDRLWLIPWDLDYSWIPDSQPMVPMTLAWDDTSTTCSTIEPLTFGIIGQMDAQCDKLSRGWATFRDEYRAALQELLDGPLARENVDAKLDAWVEQLRPVVASGLVLDRRGLTEADWQTTVNFWRLRIEEKRQEARGWL